MTQSLSLRLHIASFICTVMVVFRHSLNLRAFFGCDHPGNVADMLETMFSTLTEMAVPWFFAVSGYFFVRQSYYRPSAYVGMLWKKARTLLVPFVLWGLAGGCIMVAARELPMPHSLGNLWKWTWGLQGCGVLWFVRSLMIFMVLWPLYGWVFRVNSWWLYLPLVVLSIYRWWPVDCSLWTTEGVLFFLLGGIAQRKAIDLERRLPLWLLLVLTLVWLAVCATHPCWCFGVNRACTLLGFIFTWQWVLRISFYAVWERLCVAGFFIYVSHLYLVKTLKILLAHDFFGNQVVALLAYFMLPVVSVGILYVVARLLMRSCPRLYTVITGGR